MFFHLWPSYRKSLSPRRRAPRTRTPHPARRRLSLEPLEARCLLAANVVLEWNQVFLDTFKADRVRPLYFAREAAIVHAAIYDAVNDIDRSYTPFFADVKAPPGASLEAAAAQAAHDTMTALFPAHQATFDATLAADLAGIPPGRARLGTAVGQAVAQQILAWRAGGGVDRNCKHLDIDRFAYLRDVLRRLPAHPAVQLDELLADVWFASHPSARRRPRLERVPRGTKGSARGPSGASAPCYAGTAPGLILEGALPRHGRPRPSRSGASSPRHRAATRPDGPGEHPAWTKSPASSRPSREATRTPPSNPGR